MAFKSSNDPVVFTRELCQVPVTSLALFDAGFNGGGYVLAGEDSDVNVYAADSGRLVCRVTIFQEQSVHGIHVDEGRSGDGRRNVLVWGASCVAVFVLDAVELAKGNVSSQAVLRASSPDWIYRGAISPYDGSRGVLITAHNEILPLTFDLVRRDVALKQLASPSRLMLYSAHLIWTSKNGVLVAGGTVFGDILVWKCSFAADSEVESQEMLFSLTGHEGSIFGVDISPLLVTSQGSEVRLVASCSDDRTIRVWDISEGRSCTVESPAQPAASVATPDTTGFRVAPAGDALPPSRGTMSPIAVVMGHLSRIWSVKFAITPNPSWQADVLPLTVYSFGEDATAQRWQVKLLSSLTSSDETEITANMKHEQTFSLHSGKHLWGAVVVPLATKALVATGGADGGICLIEDTVTSNGLEAFQNGRDQTFSGVSTLDPNSMPEHMWSKTQTRKGAELFARYDFLSDNQLLITTSTGRLLVHSLVDNTRWREIQVEDDVQEDLKRCYAVRKIGRGVALLGTTSGSLYCFRDSPNGGLSHISTLPGRIYDMNCLPSLNRHGSGATVDVLVRLYGEVDSHLLVIDLETDTIQSHEQVTGLDPRFVIISVSKVGDLIAMGARSGWMSFFRRTENGFRRVLNVPPRGTDSVTAIVALPHKPDDSVIMPSHFLTTSRDGMYRIYEFTGYEDGDEDLGARLVHETSAPFGPMVEGAWFTTDSSPELIMYGFRSKYFVLWNETTREELAAIDCGGSNRTFRLNRGEGDASHTQLAFTRVSKLSIFSQQHKPHQRVKAGIHGREVRSLSFNGLYLATGSEDTTIRLWRYQQSDDSGEQAMQHVVTIKAHNAGLQKLQWLDEERLLSSAGNEEMFVWRVRTLDSAYATPAIMCEGVFTDKSDTGDLRIMDFDASKANSGDSMLVTLGFSNSAFKTYEYSPSRGFQLTVRGSYTGACLTQTRHLEAGDGGLAVLTASTDGHLAIWGKQTEDGGLKYVMLHVMPLHQNSIKGLDMIRERDTYTIMTSGDDNALGLIKLDCKRTDGAGACYTFSDRKLARNAHTAAINGILLVRLETGVLMGLTVSNDQRFKAWHIGDQTEAGILSVAFNTYSGVADAGDLVVIGKAKRRKVILAGVGVEVWRLVE